MERLKRTKARYKILGLPEVEAVTKIESELSKGQENISKTAIY